MPGSKRVAHAACTVYKRDMKLLIEILIAVFLHPVAFVLVVIDLAGRDDLTDAQKIVWGIVSLVWGIGPVLYMLAGNGKLW